MLLNSLLRMISVIVVLLVVGVGWSKIGTARLKKKGVEESKARSEVSLQAKKYAIIAAFLYMVAMVSVAGLFM